MDSGYDRERKQDRIVDSRSIRSVAVSLRQKLADEEASHVVGEEGRRSDSIVIELFVGLDELDGVVESDRTVIVRKEKERRRGRRQFCGIHSARSRLFAKN